MLKLASKKNYLFAVLAIAFVVLFTPTQALAHDTNEFNVNVKVNSDNTYAISENIKVDFKNEDRHGIFRYIPYTNGKGKTISKVSNIYVEDYMYGYYVENGSMVIQIGDEYETVTGKQSYKYSYDLTIYDDGDTSSDMLYLNLVPTGWDTPIQKSKVTVKLPFAIDESKIEIYTGLYGQKDTNGAVWSYDKASNTISIEAVYLLKGEGITLYCPLPEGTWVNQHSNQWLKPFILLPLILALGLCTLLWYLFGRDRKYVETVEFYPPEGMTPGEVGFAIDNTADQQDLVSMITYFAHKGYMEIEEYEKEKFKLNKLSDISQDEPTFAITLFNGLFNNNKTTCKIDELDEDFGTAFETSRELLGAMFTEEKSQVETSSTVAYWIGALASAGLTYASIFLTSVFSGYEFLAGLGAFSVIPLLISSGSFYLRKCVKHSLSTMASALYRLAGSILYIVGMGAGLYALKYTGSIVSMAFFAVTVTASIFVLSNMQRRTAYGAQLLGRILGFKHFIETAELDKIKMLVEESPSYFFDILPYAYVLGLTDKWSEKFESIALVRPRWYVSDRDYYPHTYLWYGTMMNNVNNNLNTNIHIPNSVGGSSGGFGGGGFSGGGFGGGGGGAW